ncbi:TonB family protein [Marinobacter caseinilyticus]|uniref:TonB family protein n=1 Tax=Marinobacter caseinilyticus TaxID=2692195 RepID=UPI0014089182|nr:TonB family protein [Marinobacter caseinilyticus]
MLEFGNHTSNVPAKYRITLAMSVALLAHTLLIAALAQWEARPEADVTRLNLVLVSSGDAEPEAQISAPVKPTATLQTTTTPKKLTITPVQTTSASDTKAPEPSPESVRPSHSTRSEKPTAPAPESISSAPSIEGKSSPIEGQADAQSTQIAPPEMETEPTYRGKLVSHIDNWIKNSGQIYIPAKSQRAQKPPKPLELELWLMRNGAIRRADITQSSGDSVFDKHTLRTVLNASPYPEPPKADQKNSQMRYRITLEVGSGPPL